MGYGILNGFVGTRSIAGCVYAAAGAASMDGGSDACGFEP